MRRATTHFGRVTKGGSAYSAKHNDRNFDIENAAHIDPNRSADNRYWHYYNKEAPDLTFEEAEKRFYEEAFGEYLEARNDRYAKSGHPEDAKSMDDYRKAARTCPDEEILQVGDKDSPIPLDDLWGIACDYCNWMEDTYPQICILDIALHADEQGGPHVHVRKVYGADDGRGHWQAAQSKALAQMGVEPPEPGKKYGRYNNSKMTFTRDCREHFIQLCRARGYEIEDKPRERSKSGLSLVEYQARQEDARAAEAKEAANAAWDAVKQSAKDLDETMERLGLSAETRAKITGPAPAPEDFRDAAESVTTALQNAQNRADTLEAKQRNLETLTADAALIDSLDSLKFERTAFGGRRKYITPEQEQQIIDTVKDYHKVKGDLAKAGEDIKALKASNARLQTAKDAADADKARLTEENAGLHEQLRGVSSTLSYRDDFIRRQGLADIYHAWSQEVCAYEREWADYRRKCKDYDSLDLGDRLRKTDPRQSGLSIPGDYFESDDGRRFPKLSSEHKFLQAYKSACERAGIEPLYKAAIERNEREHEQERRHQQNSRGGPER